MAIFDSSWANGWWFRQICRDIITGPGMEVRNGSHVKPGFDTHVKLCQVSAVDGHGNWAFPHRSNAPVQNVGQDLPRPTMARAGKISHPKHPETPGVFTSECQVYSSISSIKNSQKAPILGYLRNVLSETLCDSKPLVSTRWISILYGHPFRRPNRGWSPIIRG